MHENEHNVQRWTPYVRRRTLIVHRCPQKS